MREAFQKVAYMNLVGFVIAGERVHHQIDTPAQGEFVLALPARRQRIEAVAVGVAGPARREIVGGDDDRREAVARSFLLLSAFTH